MAKYRIHQKRFIAGHMYEPRGDYLPEIEVPDDFPAGMGMEPLDAAAKRQVEAYEKKVGVQPPVVPMVAREITQRPPVIEPPPSKPLGDFKTPKVPLPDVKAPVNP